MSTALTVFSLSPPSSRSSTPSPTPFPSESPVRAPKAGKNLAKTNFNSPARKQAKRKKPAQEDDDGRLELAKAAHSLVDVLQNQMQQEQTAAVPESKTAAQQPKAPSTFWECCVNFAATCQACSGPVDASVFQSFLRSAQISQTDSEKATEALRSAGYCNAATLSTFDDKEVCLDGVVQAPVIKLVLRLATILKDLF